MKPPASSAECEVLFTLRGNVDSDVEIPSGVIVATAKGIEYETVEEIYIPSGGSQATVLARAVVPGVRSKIIENK